MAEELTARRRRKAPEGVGKDVIVVDGPSSHEREHNKTFETNIDGQHKDYVLLPTVEGEYEEKEDTGVRMLRFLSTLLLAIDIAFLTSLRRLLHRLKNADSLAKVIAIGLLFGALVYLVATRGGLPTLVPPPQPIIPTTTTTSSIASVDYSRVGRIIADNVNDQINQVLPDVKRKVSSDIEEKLPNMIAAHFRPQASASEIEKKVMEDLSHRIKIEVTNEVNRNFKDILAQIRRENANANANVPSSGRVEEAPVSDEFRGKLNDVERRLNDMLGNVIFKNQFDSKVDELRTEKRALENIILDEQRKRTNTDQHLDEATKAWNTAINGLRERVSVIDLTIQSIQDKQDRMDLSLEQQTKRFVQEALHRNEDTLEKLVEGQLADRIPGIQREVLSKLRSVIDEENKAQFQFHDIKRDPSLADGLLTDVDVMRMIQSELEKYSADKIGVTDFALEGAGGRIVYNSAPYTSSSVSSWFYKPIKPNMMLLPDVSVGSCWAMQGSTGGVIIELGQEIHPTAVTLDHLHPSIAYDISSAPKDFAVYGLTDRYSKIQHSLGNFTYDIEANKATQTFKLPTYRHVDPHSPEAGVDTFKYIGLKILSNHGNKDYTCIYRFRVHGRTLKPAFVDSVDTQLQ